MATVNPIQSVFTARGSEYSIIEVFMKLIGILAIAGVILYMMIRLTGYGQFQNVEREFQVGPGSQTVPATIPD